MKKYFLYSGLALLTFAIDYFYNNFYLHPVRPYLVNEFLQSKESPKVFYTSYTEEQIKNIVILDSTFLFEDIRIKTKDNEYRYYYDNSSFESDEMLSQIDLSECIDIIKAKNKINKIIVMRKKQSKKNIFDILDLNFYSLNGERLSFSECKKYYVNVFDMRTIPSIFNRLYERYNTSLIELNNHFYDRCFFMTYYMYKIQNEIREMNRLLCKSKRCKLISDEYFNFKCECEFFTSNIGIWREDTGDYRDIRKCENFTFKKTVSNQVHFFTFYFYALSMLDITIIIVSIIRHFKNTNWLRIIKVVSFYMSDLIFTFFYHTFFFIFWYYLFIEYFRFGTYPFLIVIAYIFIIPLVAVCDLFTILLHGFIDECICAFSKLLFIFHVLFCYYFLSYLKIKIPNTYICLYFNVFYIFILIYAEIFSFNATTDFLPTIRNYYRSKNMQKEIIEDLIPKNNFIYPSTRIH